MQQFHHEPPAKPPKEGKLAKSATTTPKETASPKKPKWRPSADESVLLAETRKNLVKRAALESGDELYAVVHAYERLLKLDRHG